MKGSEFRACFCPDGSKITGVAPWRIPCLHFTLLMIFKSLQRTQLTFLFAAILPTLLLYSQTFSHFFLHLFVSIYEFKKHAESLCVCEVHVRWWCYKSGLWKTKIVIISWAYDDLELYNMPIIIRSVQFCHSFLAPEKLNIGQLLYLYFTW